LVTNSLENVLIVGVVGVHGVNRALDDSGDFAATCDCYCCGVIHIVFEVIWFVVWCQADFSGYPKASARVKYFSVS
jgi:hypothetical protein